MSRRRKNKISEVENEVPVSEVEEGVEVLEVTEEMLKEAPVEQAESTDVPMEKTTTEEATASVEEIPAHDPNACMNRKKISPSTELVVAQKNEDTA